VVATIAAGRATDAAGNPNSASTSTDNTVSHTAPDTTSPTVTINQGAGQADPTTTSPIHFTVVFSEAVTGFATGDVTVGGTAPGTKTATVSGSGTTYNVAVSGMTGGGTVVATIAAGRATDAAGNPNSASTSADNTVNYPAPYVVPTVWSLGYWTPGGNPPLPPSQIEWGGLTHIVHWAALVQANGALDLDTQRVSSDGPALIAEAHARGVKVLLAIEQPFWLGQTGNLQQAVTQNSAALVNNIMNVVNSYGFDGVDLNWKPFNASTNGSAMQALAAELRSRLGTKILTATAVVTDYTYWGSVQGYFDRIGVMTYDLAGTWNPYSWHNAALYDPDGKVWSLDLAVRRFTSYGVPAAKLSIGIPFFGYQSTGGRLSSNRNQGITGPRQYWSTAPSLQQLSYQNLVSSITSNNYRWDTSARVPYLSINKSGYASDRFIAYDNEQSVVEKVSYVKSKGLGGWIIWELSGDYLPTRAPNQPLLNAIKNAR
jgi:hypothetical protein